MGLFNFWGGRSPTKTQTGFKMISQNENTFYNWDGNLYQSDIVRSCITPFSNSIGKLLPVHIIESENDIEVNEDINLKFLLEEPNPLMTMQELLEKLATQLLLNNNAFAYIIRNEYGYPIEIYPINCVSAECVYTAQYDLYLRFTMSNGAVMQFPYNDIIHLRRHFNDNDVFGTSPAAALADLMNVVVSTDKSIVNAIKNSAVIKWLLKYNATMRPEDLKKQSEEFAAAFLDSAENGTGVAAVDAKADATQVKSNDYVPNAAQADKSVQRLYNFFNTNEKIVQSLYQEDEWNAYYESQIEPTAIALANEFTRKLFDRKLRADGHKIMFSGNNLQYASMNSKLNFVQLVDRGCMTPNELRRVMNLTPLEGGNTPIRRLDTAPVEVEKLEEGEQ